MRWLLPLVLLAALGCKSAEVKAFEKKCDASLRHAVETAVRTGARDTLWVLGHTNVQLDDAHAGQLAKAGASIQTATGDLFAARIPAESVGRVAMLDFVTHLALSHESKTLGQ